jgi:hypothetical protein
MKLFLLMMLCVVGCSKEIERPESDWSSVGLESLNIKLVDQDHYQHFRFKKDHHVITTIGYKGTLTAPVFTWREKDGVVSIYTHDHKIVEELTLVSVSASYITAKRLNGTVSRYTIEKE